jgi:CheY-like chemotaxis protein
MDPAGVIEKADFEVIQSASAVEAIAILTAQPDIHIVFTDIQMPVRWMACSLPGSFATAGRRSRSLRRRV